MNIIIAGGGKIGRSIAGLLSAEGYDLTVIDINKERLQFIQDRHDVMTVCGNCAVMSTLRSAGIMDADVLIATTRADEVNLLCCLTAHALNPKVHTIARIRNPEYTGQIYDMRESFGLSMTFNPEFQAAREIARLLEYPGFLQRDAFLKDRVEIVELLIDAGSPICGAKLISLGEITGCRVLVCAVVRNGRSIMPDGHFELAAGDRIFVTADTKELTKLLNSLGILTRKVGSVLLAGGGRVSFYLARLLTRAGIRTTIIEQDEERCIELADLLPGTEVILGDATLQGVLEEAGASNYDALVSLTGMDELNTIISLYGHDHGVPQVVTKVGRRESLAIVDRLSVGSAVCPQDLVGNIIVRYVRAVKNQSGAALTVHMIANGMAEASEFLVDHTTLHRDTPLRDIRLRDNVLLVCISGPYGTVEIPNGDSVFREGDTLIVVTDSDTVVEQLNDIFA